MTRISFLLLFLFVSVCAFAQPIQKGPYTVHTLSDGVYRIEDANDRNPAGIITDEGGKMISMNNWVHLHLCAVSTGAAVGHGSMRDFPTPSIGKTNAIFSILRNAIACRITPIAGNLADFFADMRV